MYGTEEHRMRPLNEDGGGTLSERVCERLEEQIINGDIAVGETLTELKLCQRLGVSRTPVREALRMLEQKGLVSIVHNRGAVVLGVTEEDLEDIYTIRTYLEGLASRRTAKRASKEQIETLREVLELQEFYAQKNQAYRINELDSQFHELIFSYSESRTLQHILAELHRSVRRYRQFSLSFPSRAQNSVLEHRQIFNAIEKRLPEQAELLTAQHISNAKNNLLLLLKKQKDEPNINSEA